MNTTLGLIRIAQGSESDYAFAARAGVTRTRLVMARKAGRATPELAAEIATGIGADVAAWIATAVTESVPDSKRKAIASALAGLLPARFRSLLRRGMALKSKACALA